MTRCCSAASRGASRTSPSRCRSRATSRCGPPTPARTTPRPSARSPRPAGIGAGFPDYPWLFATDGEYTSFAAVSSGQFATIKAPPARAARRQRGRQRAERQGRARGDAGRPGLLRRQRRRRQHRRDREVPLDRRAGLALDRRQRVPRRDVRLRQAQHALHLPRARRRPRRLAGGPRQRRGDGHGRREARQHRLHDPRAARPRRPRGQQARHRDEAVGHARRPPAWSDASTRRGGTARAPGSTPTRSNDPGNAQGLPAALDRRHAGRGGAEATGSTGRSARAARPRACTRRAARTPLLHGHVRAVPHRYRARPRRPTTPGAGVRHRPRRASRRCGRCSP